MRKAKISFLFPGLLLLIVTLYLYSAVGVYRAEQKYPSLGKFVEVEDIRLHYLEAGVGAPIVLVHGASTSLRDFQTSIFTPLSRYHRVIAFDRPGYGYSQRPAGVWPNPAYQARFLREALNKLDVENPVLVGHSWGGSVVLAYLLANPEEVSGGVLLAGVSHPWKGGVPWHNHLAGMSYLGPLFAYTLAYPAGQLLMNAAIESVFAPNPIISYYKDKNGVVLSLRPQTFLANAQDLRELSGFLRDQSRYYSSIKPPLLLITGDSDEVVPSWNHADRLIKQIPHAELVMLEGIGHVPHHICPRRISELIHEFALRVKKTGA